VWGGQVLSRTGEPQTTMMMKYWSLGELWHRWENNFIMDLKEAIMLLWTTFNWRGTGTNGAFFWRQQWTFGLMKGCISWPVFSYQILKDCSMAFVNQVTFRRLAFTCSAGCPQRTNVYLPLSFLKLRVRNIGLSEATQYTEWKNIYGHLINIHACSPGK
jgi:hypothetical protein